MAGPSLQAHGTGGGPFDDVMGPSVARVTGVWPVAEENWCRVCLSAPWPGMLLCAARQCGRVWVCGADAPTSWCGFWSGDKSLRLEVGFEIVDLGFQFRSRKLPILDAAGWRLLGRCKCGPPRRKTGVECASVPLGPACYSVRRGSVGVARGARRLGFGFLPPPVFSFQSSVYVFILHA